MSRASARADLGKLTILLSVLAALGVDDVRDRVVLAWVSATTALGTVSAEILSSGLGGRS